MKIKTSHFIQRRDFLLAATAGVSAGLSGCKLIPPVAMPEPTSRAWESLTQLAKARFDSVDGYKVDPYLRAAVELQALGKDLGSKTLKSFAEEYGNPYKPAANKLAIDLLDIVPLCRMLFAKRQGGEFRRAQYGGAKFIGGTDYADWPLDPIELVDGIPFNVVTLVVIAGGLPEYLDGYIGYCIDNCDWNNFKFEMKSDTQKQKALDTLFKLPKLKNKLTGWDIKSLSNQIQ